MQQKEKDKHHRIYAHGILKMEKNSSNFDLIFKWLLWWLQLL